MGKVAGRPSDKGTKAERTADFRYIIRAPNPIVADHMRSVRTKMLTLRGPTIRAARVSRAESAESNDLDCEMLIALEGSHRLHCAWALGFPVTVDLKEYHQAMGKHDITNLSQKCRVKEIVSTLTDGVFASGAIYGVSRSGILTRVGRATHIQF